MRRLAAAATLLVLAACTSTHSSSSGGPTGRPSSAEPSGPARLVTGSAAAEMRKLCQGATPPSPKTTKVGHVPSVITQTEQWVESVRGLRYKRPVAVAAVTHTQFARGITHQFAASFPKQQAARQSLVWQTVGALPKGTDIESSLHNFLSSQVIGYYDSDTKRLVFIGTNDPTPSQRFTLAHELTHALDDQYFDLARLDRLGATCQDERASAARGAVEGSAVFFSSGVVYRFFTPSQRRQIGNASGGGSSSTAGIPQFILNQETWPYRAGPRFIAALYRRGGAAEVNRALRNWPVSTEQVDHPSRYPSDVPTPLDVPELAPKLGKGWHDIDVEEVGEEELGALLGLRLDPTEWRPAVGDWKGGVLRAWQSGKHVAVVLRTAWDSGAGAQRFARPVRDWIGSGQSAAVRPARGRQLDVVFATDRTTLGALIRALP